MKIAKEKMVLGVVGLVIATLLAAFELYVKHVHTNMLIAYLAFIMMYSRILREVNVDKYYKITAPENETRAEKLFRILDIALAALDLLVMVLYLFI